LTAAAVDRARARHRARNSQHKNDGSGDGKAHCPAYPRSIRAGPWRSHRRTSTYPDRWFLGPTP
jgi:hypothetical protein